MNHPSEGGMGVKGGSEKGRSEKGGPPFLRVNDVMVDQRRVVKGWTTLLLKKEKNKSQYLFNQMKKRNSLPDSDIHSDEWRAYRKIKIHDDKHSPLTI